MTFTKAFLPTHVSSVTWVALLLLPLQISTKILLLFRTLLRSYVAKVLVGSCEWEKNKSQQRKTTHLKNIPMKSDADKHRDFALTHPFSGYCPFRLLHVEISQSLSDGKYLPPIYRFS